MSTLVSLLCQHGSGPRVLGKHGAGAENADRRRAKLQREYDPTVRVEGAVNMPVSVLYQEGAGLDYCVKNAGGYARNADKARVSVRYAKGAGATVSRFLVFKSEPRPGPGSVVTVPAKPEREPLDVTALLGNVAQIIAGTVAIVVLAAR